MRAPHNKDRAVCKGCGCGFAKFRRAPERAINKERGKGSNKGSNKGSDEVSGGHARN